MPAFARSKGGPLTDAQVKALATGIKPRWEATESVAWIGCRLMPSRQAARPAIKATRRQGLRSRVCALVMGHTARAEKTVTEAPVPSTIRRSWH